MHKKCIKIGSERHGMNFYFEQRGHAQRLLDFLVSAVPHKTKESRELVSHNTKSNTYNFKYTYFVEIPKICRDDLVILPKKLCREFGGVNRIAVCYKVTSKIFLFDPISLQTYQMGTEQYFNF